MDSGNGIFSTPMHVLVFENYIHYWYQFVASRYLCNVIINIMKLFHLATVATA